MNKSAHTHSTIEDTVVFGFGSQGKAQALNLRDSYVNTSVCIRKNSPRTKSVRDSDIPLICDPIKAAKKARIAAMLIPDSEQPKFYSDSLHEHLPEGAAIVFAHGFAVHYGRIKPRKDLDVLLVAPLAHADTLRRDYLERGSVPCVIAVHQDASGKAWQRADGFAKAIAGNGPFIRSTFKEEVETDLFAEQAVLCGGVPELIRASFDTLVASGYNEDIAYISCLREIRAIVDLMLDNSISGMRERISDTAQYGSITRGPRLIDENVRNKLALLLDEIRSGEFANELFEDERKGFPVLRKAMKKEAKHAIEEVHRKHRI